mgnify:CR=1 FL=1
MATLWERGGLFWGDLGGDLGGAGWPFMENGVISGRLCVKGEPKGA